MTFLGVIFDMDGTITAPYLRFADIKDRAGIGDRDLLEYLDTAQGAERERVARLLAEFEEDGAANARLNRGARTVLSFLKRKRIPTGLLTRNSRRSVELVCRKLALKFDVTASREDAPSKPAPEAIWQMTRRWGIRPEQALMVGDYKWDILCAQNAGARSAVLVNGAGVPAWAQEADYIIERLTALLPIVEGRER